MKRVSETRPYERRRNRRLWFLAILVVLFAGGAILFQYASSSPPEEAAQPAEQMEQSRPAEQPGPESSQTTSEQGSEEAWAAAISEDPSPSLAAPGETVGYGHRIALTFDDGPDPTVTPAILDILRAYNLKATFFVIGARAEQHPEIIRRIVDEGHALGNHTYYHRDMTRLPPDPQLKELRDTQTVIDQALGAHSQITLFRPPCGAPYNTETDALPQFQQVMREQQMYPVMWNIDSRDWALPGQPDSIVENVAQITPADGGVVLLHDSQPQTVDALPGILDYYTAANFEFTDVRSLLAEKYGVEPEGIEADSDSSQPGATTRSGDLNGEVPGDLSSLADCLA